MDSLLQLNILPEEQLNIFKKISACDFIKDFYLAGGTALALLIGHRQSIDFDFFIPIDFDTSKITELIEEIGKYERINEERNTINGILDGVRISFFGYKYKTIEEFQSFNYINIAGKTDIAAMKLEAIAGRGSRKDFVDLYFLLKYLTIQEMLSFHEKKYGSGLSNHYHLLKSLLFFDDAEEEPMPLMLEKVNWKEVKVKIMKEVKSIKLY